MSAYKTGQSQNRLLASMSATDFGRLRPHLKPVILKYKQSLYEAGQPIEFVYFLEAGVASNVNVMENGDAAEIGVVGNEGLIGLPVVIGDVQGPTAMYMQVAGRGLRMKAEVLWAQIEKSTSLRLRLLHYAHAYLNLVGQSAACAHFHDLQQRCARWLLMTHDRMHSDQFALTQEFLAMMLGVRRAGVTVAAGALQSEGLIRYSRGSVTILDYEGLRKRTCECYDVSRLEFDRLVGQKPKSSTKQKDK
jgi:CRP-like cAMP-binding protein